MKSYCGRASGDGRLLAVGWAKGRNGLSADAIVFLRGVLALCRLVRSISLISRICDT